jgi:hypothetical protein
MMMPIMPISLNNNNNNQHSATAKYSPNQSAAAVIPRTVGGASMAIPHSMAIPSGVDRRDDDNDDDKVVQQNSFSSPNDVVVKATATQSKTIGSGLANEPLLQQANHDDDDDNDDDGEKRFSSRISSSRRIRKQKNPTDKILEEKVELVVVVDENGKSFIRILMSRNGIDKCPSPSNSTILPPSPPPRRPTSPSLFRIGRLSPIRTNKNIDLFENPSSMGVSSPIRKNKSFNKQGDRLSSKRKDGSKVVPPTTGTSATTPSVALPSSKKLPNRVGNSSNKSHLLNFSTMRTIMRGGAGPRKDERRIPKINQSNANTMVIEKRRIPYGRVMDNDDGCVHRILLLAHLHRRTASISNHIF